MMRSENKVLLAVRLCAQLVWGAALWGVFKALVAWQLWDASTTAIVLLCVLGSLTVPPVAEISGTLSLRRYVGRTAVLILAVLVAAFVATQWLGLAVGITQGVLLGVVLVVRLVQSVCWGLQKEAVEKEGGRRKQGF